MIRLQRWENGSYFTAFSLHIPDMRSFPDVREIVKICPRSPIVSIKPVFRYRTPRSDSLLGNPLVSVDHRYKSVKKTIHIMRARARFRMSLKTERRFVAPLEPLQAAVK